MKILNKEPRNEILRPVNGSDNMQTRFICIIIVMLTACTSTSLPLSDLPDTEQPVPDAQQGDSPEMAPTTSYPSGMQNLMENAKTDLAQRLNISDSQISVVEVREVVWPDASLGCPQPGTLYSQVLTEGFIIRLEARNDIFQYHTDSGEKMVLCEHPGFPIIPVKPGEIDDGEPWMPN